MPPQPPPPSKKPGPPGVAPKGAASKAPAPAAAKPPPARKVLVFGPTGRVGSRVVKGALDRGHVVSIYTRNTMSVTIKHKNLRLCGGNISDDMAIREAVKGQDVVVCALGARDISKAHSICTEAIKRIVAAMAFHHVRRIVMVGNVGLLPHPADAARMFGEGTDLPPFLEFVFVDQRNALATLRASGLDWTVVCPPFTAPGTSVGPSRVAVETMLDKAVRTSVEEVAQLLLREAFDDPHPQARVAIADAISAEAAAPPPMLQRPAGTISAASLGINKMRR